MSARRRCVTLSVGTLLILSATPLAAQEVRIGARLGATASTLGGANRMDSWRSGVVAGVSVSARIAGSLHVESGASWIQKGASGTTQGFEGAVANRVRIDYVQIPIALRVEVQPHSALNPSILVGSALSLESGCRHFQEVVTTAITIGCHNERPRHDWSALLGASFQISFDKAALVVAGLYDHGLQDIYRVPRTVYFNRTFVLGLGISVPLGRLRE
jgi:hypothetical protein